MDFIQKKKELVEEFNKNSQEIWRLQKKQDQILGALQLIEDIEKTEKKEEKK